MSYEDLSYFLKHVGKDPSRLIFEDELTGLYNRRFLLNYFQYKVAWDALDSQPLSLLMIDVDHFKEINDRYGHDTGDQALIWVANLLRESAADDGTAIRYAGDEFAILIPGGDSLAASQMGTRLLGRIRHNPFQPDSGGDPLEVTLSIGIAAAPEDARGSKELIQRADTALYFAKKSGRNRIARAGEISPQVVFAKTALHQLEGAKIAGRGTQLAHVAEAFKKVNQGQSQFLIFEGGPGMGKSEFLETVRRSLSHSKMQHLMVKGTPQELFRPYYLATKILIDILDQRKDKGTGLLATLSAGEVIYLSCVLPQLGGCGEIPVEKSQRELREGIFTTLLHVIPKALGHRPLILFIDDLHFGDPATLILLRQLILRKSMPLFICTTSIGIKDLKGQDQLVPVEGFYSAHAAELGIRKVALTPLTADDISKHLERLFPQVKLPDKLAEDLAQITQGNPFFLAEVLRKLVLDQKVTLDGQQWVVEPLERGYLPRSLEEILSQKVAALDEESRQLLDHASVLGEDFSLSFLIGSSEKMEARVLEFIDNAVSQGLIRSDFQKNDEAVRFLGRSVWEITYGAIQQNRKRELHERIGRYQETLFEQGLLTSPAALAYHFQRSENQEKVEKYGRVQTADDEMIFNIAEALEYTGERPDCVERPGGGPDTGPSTDEPLDPASLDQIPAVLRSLLTTVRHIKLYPPGSNAIVKSTEQLKKCIDAILAYNKRLHLARGEDALITNGETLGSSAYKPIVDAFLKLLHDVHLNGLAFSRGMTDTELRVLLEALGRFDRKIVDQIFWQRFAAEQRLLHIEIHQLRFSEVERPDEKTGDRKSAKDGSCTSPAKASAETLPGESGLNHDDLIQLYAVIRCLLIAVSNAKLYPPESKVISDSIDQLMEALDGMLTRRTAFNLACVDSSLLVNGEQVDTSDFKVMADAFLRFMESIDLRSLAFLKDVTIRELRTFISALCKSPVSELNCDYWGGLAREADLSHILFNRHLYEVMLHQRGTGSGTGQSAEGEIGASSGTTARESPGLSGVSTARSADAAVAASSISDGDEDEAGVPDLTDGSLRDISNRTRELLLDGQEQQAAGLFVEVFQQPDSRSPGMRREILHICRELLEGLTGTPRHNFARLAAELLLNFLSGEKEPDIVEEAAGLLYSIALILIPFSEYPLAARIFLGLHRRHSQLEQEEPASAQKLAAVLSRELEQTASEIVRRDLKSEKPSRRENAVYLLGTMGRIAVSLLVDIIREEDELGLRQIAAGLLAEVGVEGADRLKQQLVVAITAQERLRVLDVVATVTHDLYTELACALGDESPEIRRAGLRLAQRLRDNQVVQILLDYAQNGDNGLAIPAIKSLATLDTESATEALVTVLNSSRDTERYIASCRALGERGDPAGIEALANMLNSRGFFTFRKKRSALLRATAAFSLSCIADPRVKDVLAAFVDDHEPRVRRIAREVMKN
jgi:diguanylate cyclase (GGDEF)-like protein